MKWKMTIEDFQEQADEHIDALEKLFNKLPQKGNTSEECQKINLIQHLNEVQYAVNGTTQEDLEE